MNLAGGAERIEKGKAGDNGSWEATEIVQVQSNEDTYEKKCKGRTN